MRAVASAVEQVLISVVEAESAVDTKRCVPATGRSILDRDDVKAVLAAVEAGAQERICVYVAAENRVFAGDAWSDAE